MIISCLVFTVAISRDDCIFCWAWAIINRIRSQKYDSWLIILWALTKKSWNCNSIVLTSINFTRFFYSFQLLKNIISSFSLYYEQHYLRVNWRGWPQQWRIVCLTLKSTLKGWRLHSAVGFFFLTFPVGFISQLFLMWWACLSHFQGVKVPYLSFFLPRALTETKI